LSERRGLSWPLVLIAIGLVFLLVNFGFVPGVTALQLLSLWPLLLILAGVDIAIGRRWPLAAIGIDVAVIALGLALVATQPMMAGLPFSWSFSDKAVGGERIVTVEQVGITSLSLDLNGGAGRFSVTGGSTTLVEAHSSNEDLRVRRAEFDDAHADVRIDQGGSRTAATVEVETRVANGIPTELDINGGAGEFLIDLSDVAVSGAELNIGAASLTLTLPRAMATTTLVTGAKPPTHVDIEVHAGASSIVIEVPDSVEARVTTTGALLSLRSTNSRMAVSGSAAETSGYGTAPLRYLVRITAGASSVTIR
jgi:hypothetical protein